MLRRLVLIGFLVLWQDTMLQLSVGTLLATAFLVVQIQARPYVELSNNHLATSASFCLVALFIAYLAFKQDELVGQSDVQQCSASTGSQPYPSRACSRVC
jgi:hypothetical protein